MEPKTQPVGVLPTLKPGDRIIVLDGPYRNLRGVVTTFNIWDKYEVRIRLSPWTEHRAIFSPKDIRLNTDPETPPDPTKLIAALNAVRNDPEKAMANRLPPLLQHLATIGPLTSRDILKRAKSADPWLRTVCLSFCGTKVLPTVTELSRALCAAFVRQERRARSIKAGDLYKTGDLYLVREKNYRDTYQWSALKIGQHKTKKPEAPAVPEAPVAPKTIAIPTSLAFKFELMYAALGAQSMPMDEFILTFMSQTADNCLQGVLSDLEAQRDNTANIIERIKKIPKPDP